MDKQAELVAEDVVREQIRDFLTVNFLYGEDAPLDDNASLMAQGILDSTGVLELVLFVEETYGISVDEDDLQPEHFDSISSLTHYIGERLG